MLVQDKDFLGAFECNEAARQRMPKSLLSAFDNRSWIPVTNILLRLCKGSGFGISKRGESSSSSVLFQVTYYCFFATIAMHLNFVTSCIVVLIFTPFFLKKLLRDACKSDDELFSAFLNRLFNTLSWAMTEFSVSIREMHHPV